MNRRQPVNWSIPDPQKLAYCNHVTRSDNYVNCSCGEIKDSPLQWTWSKDRSSQSSVISSDGSEVLFHPVYSTGTAITLGDESLESGFQHFWEMKITRKVYGTDFMVGVSTKNIDHSSVDRQYSSAVGMNAQSWGLSYQGYVQHNGVQSQYASVSAKQQHSKGIFSIGSLVGIHLDTFRGTLEFYVNRQSLGIAFTGLKNKELYPIVSSTTAKSGLKLICARSFPDSLQFECLKQLSKKYSLDNPSQPPLSLPPGLQQFVVNNFWFFFSSKRLKRTDVFVAEDCFETVWDSPLRGCDRRELNQHPLKNHKRKKTSPYDSSDEDDFTNYYTRSRKKELMKKAASASSKGKIHFVTKSSDEQSEDEDFLTEATFCDTNKNREGEKEALPLNQLDVASGKSEGRLVSKHLKNQETCGAQQTSYDHPPPSCSKDTVVKTNSSKGEYQLTQADELESGGQKSGNSKENGLSDNKKPCKGRKKFILRSRT